MKQFSLLLVCTNADRAGAPLHVLELASGLVKNDVRVSAVFGEEGSVRDQVEHMGVQTHIIASMRSNIRLIQDARSLRQLKSLILELRPDIVHCHSSKAGMIGRLAAAQLKIPSVYTVHGWGFGKGRKLHLSALVWCVERILRSRTSAYIAVSDADRKLGMRRLGIAGNRIQTIHNGVSSVPAVDPRAFKARSLIMVARNDYPKDYLTLASALSKVSFECAQFVGARTDELDFKEHIISLARDNASKIQFLGLRDDVPELLEQSSLFVLSSRFEGLPLSIIEAMAKGLPIVATDVGGISELVSHGVNGFLVPPGDSEALAETIEFMFQNPSVRARMGKASLGRYLESFTPETMLGRTLKVYKDVLT